MYQPAAASAEAYGAVNVRRRGHDQQQQQQQQQRQRQQSSSSTSPTGASHPYPTPAYGAPAGGGGRYTGVSHAGGYHHSAAPGVGSNLSPIGGGGLAAAASPTIPRYKHSRSTAILLLPPLSCLLLFHPTPHPLTATLFGTLVLYALDLANHRDGAALGVWFAFAVSSVCCLGGIWDDVSVGWTMMMGRISSSVLLLFCLACWETLQFRWLHKDTPSFALTMERMLHSVLPLAASSVMTHHAAMIITDVLGMGTETAALACPFVFLFCLAIAFSVHAAADSSFQTPVAGAAHAKSDDDDGVAAARTSAVAESSPSNKSIKPSDIPRAITSSDGWILSTMMLIVPPLIHILTYRRRILHSLASWDDGVDLVLVMTVSYVTHYLLIISGRIWWAKSLPWILRTGTSSNTLRGAFVPIVVSLVASIAFQLKFILPLCTTASYMMNGHETQSAVLITIYLTLSTLSGIAGLWFYGRKNQNDELLCGEYHEDAFQGILGVSGTFLGLALGMPLRLLPLPALCFLAVAIYVATRMFRYYAVLLFVTFTTFSFFVQYRFLYIQQKVDLIFGFSVSMNQFGMAGLCIGLGILSVVGLVFRASDGWGAEYLKRLDLAGIVLSAYTFLLIPLEAILLKEFGNRSAAADEDNGREVYDAYRPYMALLTGGLLICVSWHLKRSRGIKPLTALATSSASAGKILSVIIDIAYSNAGQRESTIFVFTMRAFAGAMLLISLFGPYCTLTPSHGRVRSKRALGPSGKPVDVLPDRTNMIVVGYCGIVLPAVILACIPLVLVPLISGLRGRRFYYSSSPPLSEIIGVATCLWGVATLSTTNHLLPDGGAEVWRKASALMFFLGLGMYFVAPSLPGVSDNASVSDEFASISSVGLGLGQGRSGGFGLVSAALATLLALAGPLELRERRDKSGGKDRSHILRLMIFSILFGCGVAWFVGIQSMGGEPFISLFMTITACMATSFLGTVACVLGYCVESQNFDEVQQIAKFWMGSFPIFLLVAGVSTVSKDGSPPFGLGGWLSTYLVVFGMTALAFTIAVGIRSDKTSVTRAIGNLTCFSSWVLAIICIYGQFGLAGIGVVSGTFVGVPVSILGTFASAPILLLVEGEAGETTSNRRTYNLAASGRKPLPTFGINFQSLTRANHFAPALAGTVLVFLLASLHAILLRGCAWLSIGDLGRGDSKNTKDVFSNVYGFLSKVSGTRQKEDVVTMARTNVIQSKAVASAAKLAGAGIWTAQSLMGPLLHLVGVASVIPSLSVLVANAWSPNKQSSGRMLALLPLNLVPFFLCRGIPSLWAAAVVAIVAGITQTISSRQRNYVSHMRM